MFVAGDPSGDIHASHVIAALRTREPGVECCGVGGPAMVAAGFEPLLPFEPFNRMGFLEVVRTLPFFLRARRLLVQRMREQRPDALVLVDYASFNMRLLRPARKLGVPVVWYIAPKVWAWKAWRAKVLGNSAASIGVIFPFETRCFEHFPARTVFVGNPLVEALERRDAGIRPDLLSPKPSTFCRLAILPGSRRQEVERMLTPMVGAYNLLRRTYRQLRATVSVVPWLPRELYQAAGQTSSVELFEGPLEEMLETADVALVTSGTATLETALAGVPHVIAYRTSAISYRIYKILVRTQFIGLPNIVAGRSLLPECIQEQVNAPTLALELDRFLASRSTYCDTVRQLLALRHVLGSKRPSEEVAGLVMDAAGRKKE